jgi:hypothetical protein
VEFGVRRSAAWWVPCAGVKVNIIFPPWSPCPLTSESVPEPSFIPLICVISECEMEQPEVPLEAVSEQIHHQAEHARERWILGVALSSAILAAFAAIASLLAGHHANEAMIDQIAASDQWGYYQAKGVKAAVLGSKMQTRQALGQANSAADEEKLKRYGREQEEIQKGAKEKQAGSRLHLQTHTIFARSVTMFQVAIAVAAISVLTKRRRFWLISLIFGVIGIAFLIQGAFNSGYPLS